MGWGTRQVPETRQPRPDRQRQALRSLLKVLFGGAARRMIPAAFYIHRPHPGSIMKEWVIKAIYQHLKNSGYLK